MQKLVILFADISNENEDRKNNQNTKNVHIKQEKRFDTADINRRSAEVNIRSENIKL